MVKIRKAMKEDLIKMYEIYLYYVDHTAVTFDCSAPGTDIFSERFGNFTGSFPVLIAEEEGAVLGYAYAGPFIPREAYGKCCELTIYLDPVRRGEGIGRKLYEALEEELKKQGYLNLYACIGVPIGEDPYLTFDSQRFHERMGFATVGTFHRCGYKFGRWYNMIWMEKLIGPHPDCTGNCGQISSKG